MLNTEEQPNDFQGAAPIADAPASSSRVSAEEFTAAIHALEQRKAEEARRYANTVDVSKTIQELNIDATPEEVMREVQAQRAARNAPHLAGVPPHSQLTEAQAASREQLRNAAMMLKDYYDNNISPSRVQLGVPASNVSWRDRRQKSGMRRQFGFAIGIIAFTALMLQGSHHFLGLFDDEQKTFPQQMLPRQWRCHNLAKMKPALLTSVD